MDRIGPGDRPLTRPEEEVTEGSLVKGIVRGADTIPRKGISTLSRVYGGGGGDRTRTLVSVTAVAEKAATWSLRAAPPPPVSGEGTDEHIWKIMS